MEDSPVVVGLASVFVGLTTVLFMVAIATGSPVVLVVAVPLGVTAAIMWYHATGRMAARARERARKAGRRTARGDGGARATAGGRRRATHAGRRTGDSPPPGWYEDERGQRWYVGPNGHRWRVGPGEGPGEGPGPGPGADRRRRRRAPSADRGLSERTARQRLGVGADADQAAIKRAYREKVKEVHPDAGDGDAEAFKKVTEAYETLTDD